MNKVLLVEDNEMNRDMLSKRLKKKGFEIIEAVDGIDGVNKAKNEKPSIILMDISLPGIDGWDATKQIKQDPNTMNIPVIALTAHAMQGDREKALLAGCDEYETKPVDFNRLITKINMLIES